MTDETLCRSVPFELRAAEDGGDGLTLEGYAAVFNSPTRIDSWEGTFDEEIAPGAFDRSLTERTPVLQFDHGKHPLYGSMPLGSIDSLTPDERGLPVRARLHDNWLIHPLRDAVKSGAVSGMSFRFSVVDDEWRTADGKPIARDQVDRALTRANRNDPATVPMRTLREVKLYELGPVVFPAYADTSVGVRSREVADLLNDPQVRAEVARALVGEPSEPVEAAGAEGVEPARDASPDTETVSVPSPAARDRGLKFSGVIK